MRRASSNPSATTISLTLGLPSVIVPVLSRTTNRAFPVSSSDTAVLKSIPFLAPTPFPTIMLTGVASPSAQGQLITRTAMPLARAKPASLPTKSHISIVTSDTAITAGTKIPETLSAIFAIGAFVAAASLTMLIIFDRVVSLPTLVALHFM